MLHKVIPHNVGVTDMAMEEGVCEQKHLFVLVLIELSEQLAMCLPEQQSFIAYKIKQEEFGKKR